MNQGETGNSPLFPPFGLSQGQPFKGFLRGLPGSPSPKAATKLTSLVGTALGYWRLGGQLEERAVCRCTPVQRPQTQNSSSSSRASRHRTPNRALSFGLRSPRPQQQGETQAGQGLSSTGLRNPPSRLLGSPLLTGGAGRQSLPSVSQAHMLSLDFSVGTAEHCRGPPGPTAAGDIGKEEGAASSDSDINSS